MKNKSDDDYSILQFVVHHHLFMSQNFIFYKYSLNFLPSCITKDCCAIDKIFFILQKFRVRARGMKKSLIRSASIFKGLYAARIRIIRDPKVDIRHQILNQKGKNCFCYFSPMKMQSFDLKMKKKKKEDDFSV